MSSSHWHRLTITGNPSDGAVPQGPNNPLQHRLWTRLPSVPPSATLHQRILERPHDHLGLLTPIDAATQTLLRDRAVGTLNLQEIGDLDLSRTPRDPCALAKFWILLKCLGAFLAYALKKIGQFIGLVNPGFCLRSPPELSAIYLSGFPIPLGNKARESLVGCQRILKQVHSPLADLMREEAASFQSEVADLEVLDDALSSLKTIRERYLFDSGNYFRANNRIVSKARQATKFLFDSLKAKKKRVEAAWAQGKPGRIVFSDANGHINVLQLNPPIRGRTEVTLLKQTETGISRIPVGFRNQNELLELQLALYPKLATEAHHLSPLQDALNIPRETQPWLNLIQARVPYLSDQGEFIPTVPGMTLFKLLEMTALACAGDHAPRLDAESKQIFDAQLLFALVAELGRALFIGSSFMRLLQKFGAVPTNDWTRASREILSALEKALNGAGAALRLPVQNPWAKALADLTKACILTPAPELPAKMSIHYAPSHGSNRGEVATAVLIQTQINQSRLHPVTTVPAIVATITRGLEESSRMGSPLNQRLMLMAHLEAISPRGLALDPLTQNSQEILNLKRSFNAVRARLALLYKQTKLVAVEGHEWLCLLRLTAIEADVVRCRAIQIQNNPAYRAAVRQAADRIENHPIGGLLYRREGLAIREVRRENGQFVERLPASPIDTNPLADPVETFKRDHAILLLSGALKEPRGGEDLIRNALPFVKESLDCLNILFEAVNLLDESLCETYRIRANDPCFLDGQDRTARSRSNRSTYFNDGSSWIHPSFSLNAHQLAQLQELSARQQAWTQSDAPCRATAVRELEVIANIAAPKVSWIRRLFYGNTGPSLRIPLVGPLEARIGSEPLIDHLQNLLRQHCTEKVDKFFNINFVPTDQQAPQNIDERLTPGNSKNFLTVWGARQPSKSPLFSQLGLAASGRADLDPEHRAAFTQLLRGTRLVHTPYNSRESYHHYPDGGPAITAGMNRWYVQMQQAAQSHGFDLQDIDLLAARGISLLDTDSVRWNQVMGLIANYPEMLERPGLLGLFTRATISENPAMAVDLPSAESFARMLKDVADRALLEFSRNPHLATRLCAWVARGVGHLPSALRAPILEAFRTPRAEFQERSLMAVLAAELPRLSLHSLHDVLHMAMFFDTALTADDANGAGPADPRSALTQVCDPDTLLLLRSALIREGSAIVQLPLNGEYAEWSRDARRHYLNHWLPSISNLSPRQRAEIEEQVAREILRPGARELVRHEEGSQVRYTMAGAHSPDAPALILDLVHGILEMNNGSLPVPELSYAPAAAYSEIPFLKELAGPRSVFYAHRDSQGCRCFRIVGTRSSAEWIDVVETLEGYRLRGRFHDPLKPQGPLQTWEWGAPQGAKKDLPAVLAHYGLWRSSDGKREFLIASDSPHNAQRNDIYEVERCGDKVKYLKGVKGYLWPPSTLRGALGRLTRLEEHVRVEGSRSGDIQRLSFPSLQGLEFEYVSTPRWARDFLKGHSRAFLVRDGTKNLMWYPQGEEIASRLFGARFSRSVIPLIDEDGHAQLWVVPTHRARETGALPAIIRLDLTSRESDLALLAHHDAEALSQAFCFACLHNSPPIALQLSKELASCSSTVLDEQQKAQILQRLRTAVAGSDDGLRPLLAIRIELVALRWELPPDNLQQCLQQCAQLNPMGLPFHHAATLNDTELGLLSAQLPPLLRPFLQTLNQRVRDWIGEPAAAEVRQAPLIQTPLLAQPPDRDLRLAPPNNERLECNQDPLRELYNQGEAADLFGRIYSGSLTQLINQNAPSQEAVRETDVALRNWSQDPGVRQVLEQSHREAMTEADRHREWILSSLQHVAIPSMCEVIGNLRRGESGHNAEALSEAVRLWSRGEIHPGTAPAGLAESISHYLKMQCVQGVLQRIQSCGHDPKRLRIQLEQMRTLQRSLRTPLIGDDQEAMLARERLTMQANRGIVIREDQITAVRQILEHPGAGQNRALQMRPGFGKTDIVMALALRTARNLRQNWTALVPEQLLSTTRRGLGKSLDDLLVVQLHRDGLEGPEGLENAGRWSERIRLARASFCPVLTTAETLATLEVAIAQRLGDGEDPATLDNLRALHRQLRAGRMLIDEADSILAPNRKLIFALGDVHPVPEEFCEWMNALIQHLAEPIHEDNPPDVVRLKQAFAHQTTATLLVENPDIVRTATQWLVETSLRSLQLSEDTIRELLADAPLPDDHPHQALGKLVRQVTAGSINLVFAGAIQREYGLSPTRLIGVPFKEGEEEQDTQFSFFADQLAFTFAASAFQSPIDDAVLNERWHQTLSALKGTDTAPHSRGQVMAARLQGLRDQAEEENLRGSQDSVARILRRLLEQPQNLDLRLHYCQKLLAPRIQTYAGSAHRRMSDIILGLDGVVGMTGTLRPRQLPPNFDHVAEERCSSIEVHSALLKGDRSTAVKTLPEIHNEAHAADLLDQFVTPRSAGEPLYQVMLNQAGVGHRIGSRAIAQRWARKFNRPVAFHDPHHRYPRRLITVAANGELVESEFQDAPIDSGVHDKTLFYFGPADLRGVNFVIPRAKAVFIPSSTVTDESLEQAIRRMRGLKTHHTVDVCLTHGVATALQRGHRQPTVSDWLADVLKRTRDDELKLEAGARVNHQVATQVAPATSRWLMGQADPQPNDLTDVLAAAQPLVKETWAEAGWRLGEQGAIQADRQVVRAVAQQIAQALAIEVSHMALPTVAWSSDRGYDDSERERNVWNGQNLISVHQNNAFHARLPISQEVLIRINAANPMERRNRFYYTPYFCRLHENSQTLAPLQRANGEILIGSAEELRRQTAVMRNQNVRYVRLQQCLGRDLSVANPSWRVVTASSVEDAQEALRLLAGHTEPCLIPGSFRRALEARR